MSLRYYTRLGDFTRDSASLGNQAAGTLWQPSARTGDAEIGTDEVAEITDIQIASPLDGLTVEDLDGVYLIIDGQSTQNILYMSGRDDISTNPVRTQEISSDKQRMHIKLGKSIVDCFNEPIPALANTTLKMNNSVTVITKAGGTVTQDYRIKIFGYLYNDRILSRLPNKTMPGNFTINDLRRARQIDVPYPSVEITRENWSLLPGGIDQEAPKIMPFMRFATNSSATTANTRYDFRFDIENVDDQFKDLEFRYDLENMVLILRGIGARAHTNSKFVWLYNRGDPLHEEIPPERFKVEENRNEIIFGKGTPHFPADMPIYYPIPEFGVTNHIIYRERATVSMMDDGTSIPADGVAVVLLGKRIDLGGKV